MVRQCRKLTAVGVLLGAAFSLSASAEPKAEAAKEGKAAPSQATAAGLDKHDKDKSDTPQAKAERMQAKANKAEAKAEAKANGAERKTGFKHPGAGHAGHGADAEHGRAKLEGGVSELREKYRSGSLTKEELERELRALKESRKQRRSQHQRALKERWGNSLAAPAGRAELAHHERRMAKLNRLLLLAESERKGAAKDKLVQRIEKLIALENERHERKMSQLDAPPAGQGALNAPVSTSPTMKASATTSAGQAPRTGGEK